MRIVSYCHAYVGTGFGAGGETTLHDYLRVFAARGHEVDVILSEPFRNGGAETITVDGVRVHPFTDKLQPNRWIKQADIVISHLGGAQRASLIAKSCKIPSVHVVHNDLDYTKAMAKHAQYLIYNTKWVLESFRKSPHRRPPGIVVRPPVDPGRYGVRSNRRYITLVNMADGDGGPYDKGPKVFYELAERFPNLQFLGVVGAYGHQDLRDGYPNVTFMDNTDDIRAVYRQSRIIISPSNYESYGRISVEAACSGIPSITSTAPGFREHSIGAHLVDYRDVDGWEMALRDVDNNYTSYSRRARSRANNLWETSRLELDEMYNEITRLASTRRR